MDLTKFSAYGGGSWDARRTEMVTCDQESNQKDVVDFEGTSTVWSDKFGLNSEFETIRSVVVSDPVTMAIQQANKNPEKFQMLEAVDAETLFKELSDYRSFLEAQGIESLNPCVYSSWQDKPNIVFGRDLFSMTPHGAILGRPATVVRAGEETMIMNLFARQRIPILASIVKGTFEGADMLWLDKHHVAIDHSNRTTMDAANRIQTILNDMGIACIHTSIDIPGNQHLLGVCNIINEKVACIRPEKIPNDLVRFMKELGYYFIEFDETEEVVYKQAMNLVTIAPGEVCMPDDCPESKDILVSSGKVEKVHEFDITELRKMAGGLACLTGVVSRELT